MVRVLVVINENGIPLISRTLGTTTPSFPAMGLLSALFSASRRAGATLQHLRTDGAVVAFRAYPARPCCGDSAADPDAGCAGGNDGPAGTRDDGFLLIALVSSTAASPGHGADTSPVVDGFLLDVVRGVLVSAAGGAAVAASLAADPLRRLTRSAGDALDTALDEAGPLALDPRCVECAWPGALARAALGRRLAALARDIGTPFATLYRTDMHRHAGAP
jgi:hypothetical protein